MITEITYEQIIDEDVLKEVYVKVRNDFNDEAKKQNLKYKLCVLGDQLYLIQPKFFGAFANYQQEIFFNLNGFLYLKESLPEHIFNDIKEVLENIPYDFRILVYRRNN